VIAELGEGLEAWMLPVLLPQLFAAYGNGVNFQFCALDRSRVRGNVAEGRSAFGCAVANPEDMSSESMVAALGWRLILPNGHRLARLGTDETPTLGTVDTVAVVDGMAPTGMAEFLQHVPKASILECGSLAGVIALVVTELAVALVPEFVEPPAGCKAVQVDLPPVQFALYLPRDPDALSEPARATVQAIRDLLAGTNRGTSVTDAKTGDKLVDGDAETLALAAEEMP
jgi:DNA-binding transcriptional LysR family regulator